MFDNRLPADQLDALAVGDSVLIEVWPRGWHDPEFATASVVRTTATQIVVTRTARDRNATFEERYRKRDAQRVGSDVGRAELVDPTNPRTITGLARANRRRRESAIDSLSYQWARKRDDLDLLRRLHVAVGEYLDAEAES